LRRIVLVKPGTISLGQTAEDIGRVIGKVIEAETEVGLEKPRSMSVPNKALLGACSKKDPTGAGDDRRDKSKLILVLMRISRPQRGLLRGVTLPQLSATAPTFLTLKDPNQDHHPVRIDSSARV
jgi:hypothetical protein